MEEGIFRGLFQRMLEKRFSFLVSAGIASGLFGLWHMAGSIGGEMVKKMIESYESSMSAK